MKIPDQYIPTEEKPIAVYDLSGRLLSYCTRRRAFQMVKRKKAKWTGDDRLLLFLTEQDFRNNRKQAMIRDSYICYICGDPVVDEPVPGFKMATIDHKIPIERLGPDLLYNLACACGSCNELKSDMTYEEFFVAMTAIIAYNIEKYERRNKL